MPRDGDANPRRAPTSRSRRATSRETVARATLATFLVLGDAGAFRGASARRAPLQASGGAQTASGGAQTQPGRRWMAHLLRDHPEMRCTQIPEQAGDRRRRRRRRRESR